MSRPHFVRVAELTDEIDGTTDLCAWHDLDDVAKLPVVGLVKRGLAFLGRGD
ncbi:MAG: hypothetical protein AAF389_00750 [Gemmatimonadota bacterium]